MCLVGLDDATAEESRSAAAAVMLYHLVDSAADALTEQDDGRPESRSVKWHPSPAERFGGQREQDLPKRR